MIYVGIVFILIGFSAIIFKKYPSKNAVLRNLQRKYDNVDEKKVINFDGIFYLLSGVIILICGIFEMKNNIIFYLTFMFIITFLCIIYYPIRRIYLNLK